VPFTHWLAWNLPARAGQVPGGVPPAETGPGGSRQGTNDAGNLGYTGPCPPEGTHTYRFRAYALDAQLGVEAGAQRQAVVRAIADRAIAIALLSGEYSRSGDGG
jgi:Raf kinase inhibitor-like YbhB/YbcL family protein